MQVTWRHAARWPMLSGTHPPGKSLPRIEKPENEFRPAASLPQKRDRLRSGPEESHRSDQYFIPTVIP
jgi:hypothetical protein